MKTAFIVRNREDKPYFVAVTSDDGTTFRAISETAKNLVDAFKDEYKDSKITKQELSVALDRGMTVEGPMPETLVAQALRRAPKPKEKSEETISVSDLPITFFSFQEKRQAIQFKAKAFVSESRKTSFNYEVKRVRAIWDPSLSIPGTGRRGGWRCPVGTRYGGQITDRFGRNCGWGVARRIANAVTNIGERMESLDDRRRGRRVERRNRRMLERLGRAERGGKLERGLREVAEALGGEETPKTPKPSRRKPEAPRRRGGVRRAGEGRFDSDARDAGLRTSERRRVRREIEEPGAPRTGLEEIVEPKPKRPTRARRRRASEDRAKETAGKRPAGEPMEPSERTEPKPKRKKTTAKKPEEKKPTTKPKEPTPQPDFGKADEEFDTFADNVNFLVPLTDEDRKRMKGLWDQEEFARDAQLEMENMIRDGNWGDVEALKERIAQNDEEIRGALARVDKDIKSLREENLTGQKRIDALDRIVVNKREIQRRSIENDMFREAVDNPPWRQSEPPETPPSARTPTPPQPPTRPKPDKQESKKPGLSKFGFARRKVKRDNAVAPLGDIDDKGFVVGKRVDVGNAGIKNKADAVNHLKNGGDVAEVPDELLADAIKGNGVKVGGLDDVVDRAVFQDLVNRGLINDDGIDYDDFKDRNYHKFLWAQAISASGEELPEEVQKKLKGKKFLLIQAESAAAPILAFKVSEDGKRLSSEGFVIKPPDKVGAQFNFPLDVVNELLGAELAQMVGLPGEAGRVDGLNPKGDRLIVLPFGGNFIDGKIKAGGYVHEGDGAEKAAHVLLNYVVAAADRHPFNAMAYKDDNGKEIIFPIDFGRYGQYVRDRVDATNLREYYFNEFQEFEPFDGADDIVQGQWRRGGRLFAEKLNEIDWDAIEARAVEQWRGRMKNFGIARNGARHEATEAEIRAHIQQIRGRARALLNILTTKNFDDVIMDR
jgi:hypothetical protein